MPSGINKSALTDSQRNFKKRQKAKAIKLFKSGDTAGAIEIIELINKEFCRVRGWDFVVITEKDLPNC